MPKTWPERIARARLRPGFLAEDRVRAGRWTTCGVGELLQRRGLHVERLDNGSPVDEQLRRLGTAFFAAVLANDVARAESTLTEIENRAWELASQHSSVKARRARRPAASSTRAASRRIPDPGYPEPREVSARPW